MTQAKAFDRMECDSNLGNYTLSLTKNKKDNVLTKTITSTVFKESQSKKLFLLDKKGIVTATLFPWNSVYVRLENGSKKKLHASIQEFANGFLFELNEPSKKKVADLKCQFSF